MNFSSFWPMLKKELYEQYRTYRAFIALIILLLLGISAPIVTKLTPDLLQSLGNGITIVLPTQTANDALASYLKNMTQLPGLMLILLAMGSVADERSRGTAITVLTKPVSRTVFVLTKFLAYAAVLLVSTALSAASAYFYTTQLFSALPGAAFLLLNLALFIFFLLTLAIIMLASVLLRNTVAAGGLAFGGFLVLSILPGLNTTTAQAFPSILFSSERLSHLLAGTITPGEVLWPLGAGLGWVVVLLVLACLIFQHQEI